MKKFLVVLALAAIAVTGAFAQSVDVQFPQGTWTDTKYNADWVFQITTTMDTVAELHDSTTGDLIYKFTKDNIQDFQVLPSADGISVSWKCKAKNREYKFTKPTNLGTDLTLEIHNTYFNEDHSTTIPYKQLSNTDGQSPTLPSF